jgi:hypothetical protein
VFPEGDVRRNPFLGGIGRKLLPRLQPALLRDRPQHRREKIGHRTGIAQRRMRGAFRQTVILAQGLQLAVPGGHRISRLEAPLHLQCWVACLFNRIATHNLIFEHDDNCCEPIFSPVIFAKQPILDELGNGLASCVSD